MFLGTPWPLWTGFTAAVLAFLVLDLTVLHRDARGATLRQSLLTTLVWVALATGFGLGLGWWRGFDTGLQFFTGYVIEYSLSVDNIFIFVLVFGSFRVAAEHQYRLLFWGVLGALVMRGLMIAAGTALLARFEWLIYLFGAYILYAGLQMLRHREPGPVEEMAAVRWARRLLPLSTAEAGGRFTVREGGRLKFTLLFLVLIVIETTDLVFALDSIPAIFGVTTDPFIVFTSNVCAILGLRSLYFLLAGAVQKLVYLHFGLACVLVFIGGKMLAGHWVHVSTPVSLAVVGGLLGASIVASLLKARRDAPSR